MIVDVNGGEAGLAGLDANERELMRALDLQTKLLKESIDLADKYVDPLDAFRGPDGSMWRKAGTTAEQTGAFSFLTEQELTDARDTCRALWWGNEFAINGHENRISYTIGTGHVYTVVPKGDASPADSVMADAQAVIDDFVRENKWQARQQEIFRRRDRDGECFLRFFKSDDLLKVRFVEPGQVAAPENLPLAHQTWGVETKPDDVETVLKYWIDGSPVPADQIQHRKLAVDCNCKRGVMLFWPVHQQLKRIQQLQRNMDAVAAIQTAIALIRKHEAATKSTIESFRNSLANVSLQDDAAGVTRKFTQYQPGTILDAPAGTDYLFPSSGVDASRFVEVKQSALRGVAARLCMPEFMLSSKSDDVNYASALVAEGPAVKMFERLQAEQIEADKEILIRQLRLAGDTGRLPQDVEDLIEIQADAPTIATRDRLQEANANEIYERMQVKSIQTICGELGLDYDEEQGNMERHDEANPKPDFPPLVGIQQPAEMEPEDEEPEDEEPEPDVEPPKNEAMKARTATHIIEQVARKRIPRPAGVRQLQKLYECDTSEAERLMSTAGKTFIKEELVAAPPELHAQLEMVEGTIQITNEVQPVPDGAIVIQNNIPEGKPGPPGPKGEPGVGLPGPKGDTANVDVKVTREGGPKHGTITHDDGSQSEVDLS